MYQIRKSQRLHSLDPFNRAGTTVKRVFYCGEFMSKHTRGPWAVEEWDFREPDGCVINSGMQVVAVSGSVKNGVKCSIYAATEDGDGEEMEANLHLIAAAPELLAALEWLLADMRLRSMLDGDVDSDGCVVLSCGNGVLYAANKAIAKAKGIDHE